MSSSLSGDHSSVGEPLKRGTPGFAVPPRLRVILLGALFAPLALAAQDSPITATLQVTITGLRPKQAGELLVALYDRESAWLVPDSATTIARVAVDTDSLTITFDSLPCDSGYAIAVTHDRNGNGKLDMRWFPFPKPKEGAGVSQNHMRMGKPRYEEARFPVCHDFEHQRIGMRY